MKIYTKTGDDGTTGLLGGKRVRKNDTRVAAYGEVDELNAVLGWCLCEVSGPIAGLIQEVQGKLFMIGAKLATPPENQTEQPSVRIDEADVTRLEEWIDQATDEVPPLKHFILPGGCEAGARLHIARAVCRRVERAVVELAQEIDGSATQVQPVIVQYLNRLSDLLFVWARQVNHAQCKTEIPWPASNPKP